MATLELPLAEPLLVRRRIAFELMDSGAITGATIESVDDHELVIRLRIGNQERLVAHDGKANLRRFRSMDTATQFLVQLGVNNFAVKLTHWKPAYAQRNSDALERMRRAREAAGEPPAARRNRIPRRSLQMTG